MGHAYEQMPIHKVEDQKAMIERSVGVLERFTGTRPVGWLGPGLTQTYDTPELLTAAGIKYIGDWVYDDEPTEISHRQRAAGDIALYGRAQRHPDDAGAAPRVRNISPARCVDTFNRLHQEGAERAKIMAIAIHPYISGQPHRIKYLEAVYYHIAGHDGVLHWNGVEILDWYLSQKET